jgi:hypothetical protein
VREAGPLDVWQCLRVRPDAGTGADASACPRLPPLNGGICTSVGEVCDYGREACTCESGDARDRWSCTRDAGTTD